MVTLIADAEIAPAIAEKSAPPTPRSFRPDVEGLRAVAVGAVVLYHAGVPWLTGGYVGVDIFFVISGFLITGLLLREFEKKGRLSMADFYARRARRILPLASLVIVATLAASSILLSTARLGSIARDGLWSALFSANFRIASTGADYLNATAPPSPLQHYWSLAVEEQFYLAWPLLLWGGLVLARRLHRTGRAMLAGLTTVACVVSFAWCVMATQLDANAAYFSPFTRAWELGVGALLALCSTWLIRLPGWSALILGWAGIALIVFSVLTFDAGTVFRVRRRQLPVGGAALVIAAGFVKHRSGPEALLGLRPMRRLGAWSYSLYLVHWPILQITEGRFPDLSVLVKLGLMVGAVVLAAGVHRFFENPVRRAPALATSTRRSLMVGGICIVVAVAYAGMYVTSSNAENDIAEARFAASQSGLPSSSVEATSIAQVQNAVLAASTAGPVSTGVSPPLTLAVRDRAPAYSNGCLVNPAGVTSPDCLSGVSTATAPLVVLFGDSHAVQWSPALTVLANRYHFRLKILTKDSCPASTVPVYDGLTKRDYPECDQWRSWALGQIAALHPAMVVVSEHIQALAHGVSSSEPAETRWQEGLTTTMKALTVASGKVVMLSDAPVHAKSSPDCLEQNPQNALLCADPVGSAILKVHQAADRQTVTAAGAKYVDVTSWFCAAVCPAIIDNLVTTIDGSHITTTYSKYLAGVLANAAGLDGGTNAPDSATIAKAVAQAAAGNAGSGVVRPPVALAARDSSPAYNDGCLVQSADVVSPACTFGDPTASEKVVLLGDSHAAQWMPALQDISGRTPLSLTVLTKANCPAPAMTVFNAQLGRTFTECDQWRAAALTRIVALKPTLVVISSSFHGATLPDRQTETPEVEKAWDQGLATTITTLRKIGARVVVVQDVANHAQAVPDCLAAHGTSPLACATGVLNANLVGHERTQQQVAAAAGAQYVTVQPWFCTTTLCPAVIDGIVTDFDDSHLTATYSTYLGHAFGVALGLEKS